MMQKKEMPAKISIPVEMSGRHVHLTAEDVRMLFGRELTIKRELSQPKQYVCEERVDLIGPKGMLCHAAVLWPPRLHTQVELSKTDALALGLKPPVRISGDLAGSCTILIRVNDKVVTAEESAIIAKRHLHLHVEDSELLHVRNGDTVMVLVHGRRPLILTDVTARVDSMYRRALHIDFDEGNAADCDSGTVCSIWGERDADINM